MSAPDYTYELTSADEAALVQSVVAEEPTHESGLWLVNGGPMSLAARLGRLVEQRVFDEAFSGHDPGMMTREYGPWEERSTFFVALTAERPVGVVRLVFMPDASQPSKVEHDLDLEPSLLRQYHGMEADDPLWEYSTFAVVKEMRRSRAMLAVFRAAQDYSKGILPGTPYIAAISFPIYESIRRLGVDVVPLIGLPPSTYMGAWSQPAFFPRQKNYVGRGGPDRLP